jgi:2-polyprenyl-3-methyl-5-hydroxy-6-metoxy-1,4-benzoquinol methylase
MSHHITFKATSSKTLLAALLDFHKDSPTQKSKRLAQHSKNAKSYRLRSDQNASEAQTANLSASHLAPLYPFEPTPIWYNTTSRSTLDTPKSGEDSDALAMLGYYQELSEAAPLISDKNGEFVDYLCFAPLLKPVEGFLWVNAFQKSLVSNATIKVIRKAQRQMKNVLYKGISFDRIDRLADIGCGYGSDLIALSKRDSALEIHGFDISLDQLKVAKGHIEALAPGANIHLFHKNSAEDNWDISYQMVISCQVIHHIRNKQAIFSKIGTHLDEGGIFVCAEILSNHSEAIYHEQSTAYFETINYWAKGLSENNLMIKEVVDASQEVAHYLHDPDFYDNLEEIRSRMTLESTQHLEGSHLLGELLRRRVARYFLFSAQKTSLFEQPEIERTNRLRLSIPTAYPDAVSESENSEVKFSIMNRQVEYHDTPINPKSIEATVDTMPDEEVEKLYQELSPTEGV